MFLKTKADLIANVAANWKRQYYEGPDKFGHGHWKKLTHGNSQEVYEKLLALSDGAGEAEIEAIIGNGNWTRNICGECKGDVGVVVVIGEELDCESSTAWVCLGCLRMAIELVEANVEM